MSKRWLAIWVVYVALWIWDAGCLNAYCQHEFNLGPVYARRNLAFSIMFAGMPPAILITPCVTGFYYYGWSLSVDPKNFE
jgi:hypothetical protein